ncbi:DUF1353 domain-containing protein [Vibrio europaeus]|nr:DUF1353 domain-containing protein [Vibrio europaeus]MDC5853619.1 DUF1353 domain-containing protein [Vibrio europaeus]
MPVLIPIRLPTQGLPFWRQWLRWCTAVRSWQLAEDWRCCHQGRVFVIPSGFVFDGASFPRGLWGGLALFGGVVWRRCRRTVAEPLLPKALVVIDRESR